MYFTSLTLKLFALCLFVWKLEISKNLSTLRSCSIYCDSCRVALVNSVSNYLRHCHRNVNKIRKLRVMLLTQISLKWFVSRSDTMRIRSVNDLDVIQIIHSVGSNQKLTEFSWPSMVHSVLDMVKNGYFCRNLRKIQRHTSCRFRKNSSDRAIWCRPKW